MSDPHTPPPAVNVTPTSDQVDFQKHTSIERSLSRTERIQAMHGFNAEYTDIVDYILRCTHRIWEEKAVGLIYTHYSHNCVIHTPSGTLHGREGVVSETLKHLATFPDRKLYGDDVIWAGDDQAGFHTSHRILTVAHHTGHSAYGPPTGKKLLYRTVANCLVRENLIVEEWLVRDNISIVRQLGLDPWMVARQVAEATPFPEVQPGGDLGFGRGQLPPNALMFHRATGFNVEDFVRGTWHDIWNRRLLNLIGQRYHSSLDAYWPGGRKLHGPHEQLQALLTLLGAFTDAKMTLDHLYWNGSPEAGYRAALRWTLTGTHDGYGPHGAPTGKRVRIMGITHQHIVAEQVVREWTVFDEMGLLVQLVAE